MEYFTYEMDVFKFERISHYDLYFKPSVPPMPDFFRYWSRMREQ